MKIKHIDLSSLMVGLHALVFVCVFLAMEANANERKNGWRIANVAENELMDQGQTAKAEPELAKTQIETPEILPIETEVEQNATVSSIEMNDQVDSEPTFEPSLDNSLEIDESEFIKTESEANVDAKQEGEINREQLQILIGDVEDHYQQLRRLLENENPYSPKLAEAYFSYALLLRETNQYEEAVDAFTNSLHIEKINNGLYSLSQRVVLVELFETYFVLGRTKDFEQYLERILWIESKNKETRGNKSFDLLMKVSHFYLNQYFKRPISTMESAQHLMRAKKHLNKIISIYDSKPMDELLMPYGELALISSLIGKMDLIIEDVNAGRSSMFQPTKGANSRKSYLANYLQNPFPVAEDALVHYIDKANNEKNNPHVLKGLIGLGDLNQIFNRKKKAQKNYLLAWKAARLTGQDEMVISQFSQAVALPNFQQTTKIEFAIPDRPSALVPLEVLVSPTGRVKEVAKLDAEHEYAKYYSKARRVARHTPFRPKYTSEGVAIEDRIDIEVRVYTN